MIVCTRCGFAGAGCLYKGGTYHMCCKLEQKLDDGVLGPTPVAKPRKTLTSKRTGERRFKRTFGGFRA